MTRGFKHFKLLNWFFELSFVHQLISFRNRNFQILLKFTTTEFIKFLLIVDLVFYILPFYSGIAGTRSLQANCNGLVKFHFQNCLRIVVNVVILMKKNHISSIDIFNFVEYTQKIKSKFVACGPISQTKPTDKKCISSFGWKLECCVRENGI